MKNHRRLIIFFLFFAGLFSAKSAWAVCPVCTVAVGACVGLSRYLGIDDAITGVWIGGLIISLSIWTMKYLENRNWKFSGYKPALLVFYYLIILVPFYWQGIIGHPFNKIWSIDKLLVGIIFGSIFFLLSAAFHAWLKKNHGNQVYFPFQKVVIPIITLGLLSLAFYFLTCE